MDQCAMEGSSMLGAILPPAPPYMAKIAPPPGPPTPKIANFEALKLASAGESFLKFSKAWGLFWTYLSDSKERIDGGSECGTARYHQFGLKTDF